MEKPLYKHMYVGLPVVKVVINAVSSGLNILVINLILETQCDQNFLIWVISYPDNNINLNIAHVPSIHRINK